MRLCLAVVVALVCALPQVALACPTCALDHDTGVSRLVMLGGMILLPFFIAAAVVAAIRRALRDDEP